MADLRDKDGMLRAALNNVASDIHDVGSDLKARGLLSAQDELALSDAKAIFFEAWQKLSTDNKSEQSGEQ